MKCELRIMMHTQSLDFEIGKKIVKTPTKNTSDDFCKVKYCLIFIDQLLFETIKFSYHERQHRLER